MGDSLFASALLPRTSGLPAPIVANPLAAISDAAKTAGSIYDLRQAQAKEAAGQEFLKSIDPATGQPNQAQLLRNLAANPATAMYAQESAQKGITLDKDTYDLHNTRLTGLFSAMGQLVAQYPNGVPAAAAHAAIDQSALLSPEEKQYAHSQITDNGLRNSQFILQGMSHNLTAQQALDAAKPPATIQNVGNQLVPVQKSGQTALGQPEISVGVGSVPLGMSPEAASEIVSLHAPGQPDQQMTRAQAQRALEQNPALRQFNPQISTGVSPQPAQATPQQQPGAQSAPQPRPQPQPQPQADVSTAKRADAAATTAPAATPAYGSQGAPGQLATKEAQAATGQQQAQVLENAGQGASTVVQPLLAGMLTDLQGAKDATGFGVTLQGRVQQLATRLGIAPPVLDLKNKQGSLEALGKLFGQYEAQQLGALGSSPSDSRQALASSTSPNLMLSPEGNRQIIRNLQGNNDALDTMYRAWMTSDTRKNNPGGFGAWREAFTAPIASGPLQGARFDPTVFAVSRMYQADPVEAHRYLSDLKTASPADYAQFRKDWALALKEQWVSPLSGAKP